MKVDLITHYGTDLSCVNAAPSVSKLNIVAAFKKGYRVTPDGTAFSHKNKKLKIAKRGNQRYPMFGVTLEKSFKTLPIHWLAAYSFFGEAFLYSPAVRHLNGDTTDLRKSNIALGTHSENELDKPAEIRRASAVKARAAQGHRPYNAKLTQNQAEEVRRFYKILDGKTAPAGTVKELCTKLGVSRTVLCKIKNGQYYAR